MVDWPWFDWALPGVVLVGLIVFAVIHLHNEWKKDGE